MIKIRWTGQQQVDQQMQRYADLLMSLPFKIATFYAPLIEGAAKDNAVWTDRTGNARQSLRGEARALGQAAAAIYLIHGMDYGVHLELKYSGRYAIIMPTLEQFYPDVRKTLRDVTR